MTVGLLMLDGTLANVQLSPVVFVLVVAATAFGGMRFGVTFGTLAALAFTATEWHRGGRPYDPTMLVGTLIVAASASCIAVLVVFLQRRARANSELLARLREAELERKAMAADASDAAARAALARTEANYRAVGESIPFGMWQTDADGTLVYASESYRRITGMQLAELRDGGWLRLVPEAEAHRFLQRWAQREQGEKFFEGEYRLKGIDGRLYTILSRGVRLIADDGTTTGWAGMSLDITDRKRATDAVALLEEVGRQLMLSLDPAAILERVASVCANRFADWVQIDVVQEDGALQTAAVVHVDPARQSAAAALRAFPIDLQAPIGIAEVARTGRSQLHEDVADELLRALATDDDHRTLLQTLGMRSAIMVPLIARQRVIGVLTLVAADSGRRYDREDLGVAEVLGVRTALAYQNALHYVREVRVADTLQRASLPSELPQLPGVRVNATYVPGASESEIGGDWYDAFLLPDGTIGITIGDVAGKGLRAAVAMGVVRQALRYAALDGLDPSVALTRVNRHLCHERTGMVTAITAKFDPATNALSYASAGHPAPVIGTAAGSVRQLATQGVPLGLFAESAYVELHERLAMGEMLVLYTDGLIEHSHNIAAGERELEAAVAVEASADSPNPALAIQRRVIADRPKDDVAVLTLSLSPSPIEEIDVEAPAIPASARVLRQALRRLAAGAELDEERTFSLLVAAGEAISNAIEHAYGLNEGLVRLRGRRTDGRLEIEISDSGNWRAPRSEGRGRGLPLMRRIVDHVDVCADGLGTTVRLGVDLEGVRLRA